MLTVAIPKRNKLQNIIVLTPKDGRQDTRGNCRVSRCLCTAVSARRDIPPCILPPGMV